MPSENPLIELLACPRCDKTPLAKNKNDYSCGACRTKFPLLNGIPWLFADPGTSLGEWRQRWNFAIEKLQNDGTRVDEAMKQRGLSDLTLKRLERLGEAYREQAGRMREVMKPLELSSLEADYATYLALRTRLPPDHGLITYYANIHRDWVWGDAENEASISLVGEKLGQKPGKVLVLGSGASRLAYDLHMRTSAEMTVAMDFNPFLILLAQRVINGESIELYEFPIAPVNLESTAILQSLAAGEPVREGFHFVLGDALRTPFANSSFDAVVTPWLIDVIPENFENLAPRINSLLKTDGRWINFGSLAFANQDLTRNYSFEETVEVIEASAFSQPDIQETTIPYMASPHSRHARQETVVTFAATKTGDAKQPPRHVALPDWIVKGDEAVPVLQLFQMQAMSTRIYAFIMSLIDGKRTIKDMAKLMQEQRLMTRDEGEVAIRNFLIKMFEDSQRQNAN